MAAISRVEGNKKKKKKQSKASVTALQSGSLSTQDSKVNTSDKLHESKQNQATGPCLWI